VALRRGRSRRFGGGGAAPGGEVAHTRGDRARPARRISWGTQPVASVRTRQLLPPLAIVASRKRSRSRSPRELRERGYDGAYTAVKRFVAAIRPHEGPKPFELRFETPAGHQAQVDFARLVVSFEDESGVTRIVWLFSLVLGHSRHIVVRFVLHQDLQTLLRCHMKAFEASVASRSRSCTTA
jgi:hypothetical protein